MPYSINWGIAAFRVLATILHQQHLLPLLLLPLLLVVVFWLTQGKRFASVWKEKCTHTLKSRRAAGQITLEMIDHPLITIYKTSVSYPFPLCFYNQSTLSVLLNYVDNSILLLNQIQTVFYDLMNARFVFFLHPKCSREYLSMLLPAISSWVHRVCEMYQW